MSLVMASSLKIVALPHTPLAFSFDSATCHSLDEPALSREEGDDEGSDDNSGRGHEGAEIASSLLVLERSVSVTYPAP